MKTTAPISAGHFDSLVWIHPEGRGTFQESPLIKKFVEDQSEDDVSDVVIDLEKCPGMDSTFMGMLAGLGIAFRKRGKGKLSIVGTSDKTKASLQELGLHHLSTIEPKEGSWKGEVEKIRANLQPIDGGEETDKAGHVLECHENLCETDEGNMDRFKTVLDMMGSKMTTPPKNQRGE